MFQIPTDITGLSNSSTPGRAGCRPSCFKSQRTSQAFQTLQGILAQRKQQRFKSQRTSQAFQTSMSSWILNFLRRFQIPTDITGLSNQFIVRFEAGRNGFQIPTDITGLSNGIA